MSTKTRRQYTAEFKTEAVRLVRDSAQPVAQVARNLGSADPLLYRWRAEQQQAEHQGRTRQSMRVEQGEFARLRRENATLKQERDCLRRAAAFFARSRDEISRNPGARPSRSDPPDVPSLGRVFGRV